MSIMTTALEHGPEIRFFFEELAEGRFQLRHCRACRRAHWYPRAICPHCASMETEWCEASGRGTIYSYSVMRRVPEPYAIAYVALAEGPIMMSNIVDCSLDDIRVGAKVRLVIRPRGDSPPLPLFTLA